MGNLLMMGHAGSMSHEDTVDNLDAVRQGGHAAAEGVQAARRDCDGGVASAFFPASSSGSRIVAMRTQIDTIDYYRNSSVFFSFPTQGRLLSVVSRICPDVRLAPSGAYEMSERCPLLIVDMP